MSGRDSRPEAQSFNSAAQEAKDSIVDSAKYVKDRVTAPASGDSSADKDAKQVASDKAQDAKEHSKGVVESISDGAKYVGSRFTANPSGTEGTTQAKTSSGEGWFSKAGDKAQEEKDRASSKLGSEKEKLKDSYEDTQQTLADKLSTTPAEEAKAQGQVPGTSATLPGK